MCMFGKHFMTSGKNIFHIHSKVTPFQHSICYFGFFTFPSLLLTAYNSLFAFQQLIHKSKELQMACLFLKGTLHLFIPILGIAWTRSQFPHSCVCERFIYTPRICPRLHIFPAAEYMEIDRGTHTVYKSLTTQTHEWGNVDCGRAIPFLGFFVSNFRYWFFAVYWPTRKVVGLKYRLFLQLLGRCVHCISFLQLPGSCGGVYIIPSAT